MTYREKMKCSPHFVTYTIYGEHVTRGRFPSKSSIVKGGVKLYKKYKDNTFHPQVCIIEIHNI